jgi:DNA polymerase-3 subunit alpha
MMRARMAMKHAEFVHLHLHTDYSLLDGACRIHDVMAKAAEFRMPAVAITDHGNLHGAIEFYKAAQQHGVKPIIGCEAYIAPGSRLEKKATGARDAAYHFVLLAKDDIGYKNLIQLITSAHLEGFYYRPRIDKEILAQHSKGLIGLTACLKGEVAQNINAGQLQRARDVIDEFRNIFEPGDFYLEIHDHGIEEQRHVARMLRQWSSELDLPLVASNDVHYLMKQHHEAHDVFICLQTGAALADEKRMRYATPNFYFKSPEEMAALFAEAPDALKNTLEIAEKCNLMLEFGKIHYPKYAPPEAKTREQFLYELCDHGLRERYGIEWLAPKNEREKAIVQRLDYELKVIEKTGFADYFLIVWDFVNFAKTHGIPVGPGRGSAAGSLVAYVLGITDIDPLRYHLLFERFLNPERISPPDIDMDFCYNRRPEIIEYVRQKYGEKNVAQIITFGTLGAKMVVRDVGRVLGMSYGDCDRIAKMIPNDIGITLKKALEISADLKKAYENDPQVRRLIEHAFTLEGLARQAGTHAAGVVIGAEPLTNVVPLTRGTDGNEIITQYSMDPLGDLGLLKMDFLGLKTLTVIKEAVDLIEKTRGERIDIRKIPLDDPKTFDLLNKANTIGVFQLESTGMRDLCRRIGVDSIDVIIALIALFRPGPMNMLNDYVERKHGKIKITYDHPLLEPILKETYGVFVYQEQVMQAASALAGYTLGAADILRRAMGKKKPEEMEKQREIFVRGCAKTNKIPRPKAERIFDTLARFAGYGFNKSHSAAYAVVAYQTAWLKANYTVEFMAALLSNELSNTDKIQLLINECKRMGIEVLPPDVNESGMRFTVHDQKIRFGLAAVKNVGEVAVENIIAARADGKFTSLSDFCERVDLRVVNRKVIESLVKCGAFDSHGVSRAQLFAEVETAMSRAASLQRDRDAGQATFFVAEESAAPLSRAPKSVAEWPQSQMLAYEKELLGFYVTGHPLTQFAEILQRYELSSTAGLGELQDGQLTRLGGIVTKLQMKTTRAGKPMAILLLEDLEGSVETVVWPETYAKFSPCLRPDAAIFVCGAVNLREEKPKIVADELIPLKDVPRKFTKEIHIRLAVATAQDEVLRNVRDIFTRHKGQCPVYFCFRYPSGEMVFMQTHENFAVTPSMELVRELENVLGEDTVWLKVDTSTSRPKRASAPFCRPYAVATANFTSE